MQLAVLKVSVRDVQRTRQQAADVDRTVLPENDAVGVDQVDRAVGLYRAFDDRTIATDNSVQDYRRRLWLNECDGRLRPDIERVPVDDGLRR